jgi:uncharacterized protein (TIGR02611 family)
MEHFKNGWSKTPRTIRLPIIFIIGWLVVLAGIVMLITPGPGWAAIFLGFAILATEFTSAAKVRDWLVANLKMIIDWLKMIWRKISRRK